MRELQNTILRAYYCSGESPVITLEHLPEAIVRYRPAAVDVEVAFPTRSSPNISDEDLQERNALIEAAAHCGNDVESAAKSLGMSRATFYRKLKLHGIRLKDLKKAP